MNTDGGQLSWRRDYQSREAQAVLRASRGTDSPASNPAHRALAAPKRSGEGGFTLIEVLVALVIFAFSGIMLASAYVNVLSAHQAALHRDVLAPDRRLVREALFAEPVLEKVEAWNDLTLPGGRPARWRATVIPTPIADLFDVALEIELPPVDGKKQPAITETCRLLRPTWSQPAEREKLRVTARSKLALRTFQ